MQQSKVKWLTRTAVLIALLVAMQAITTPLGSSLLTGSLVNCLLVLSVMMGGLTSGLTVAAISPIAAKLFGIGPLWSLIPFIVAGNITLVLLWHWLGRSHLGESRSAFLSALAIASAAKCGVLYLGIVKWAIPVLLKLPEKQAAVLSGMFSLSQLATALIGGGLALLILPVLYKAEQTSTAL